MAKNLLYKGSLGTEWGVNSFWACFIPKLFKNVWNIKIYLVNKKVNSRHFMKWCLKGVDRRHCDFTHYIYPASAKNEEIKIHVSG